MQVGQRLSVGEPGGFGHKALDELQHPCRCGRESP
jgi:hypothetical protein